MIVRAESTNHIYSMNSDLFQTSCKCACDVEGDLLCSKEKAKAG